MKIIGKKPFLKFDFFFVFKKKKSAVLIFNTFKTKSSKTYLHNFRGLSTCLPAIMQPFRSASERQIKSNKIYFCTTLRVCLPARSLSCNCFQAPASVRLSPKKLIFFATLRVCLPARPLSCRLFRAPASVRLSPKKYVCVQPYGACSPAPPPTSNSF
jgi:hypothetical protein